MNIFKHRGAFGDIIYAIPTIKALGGGILYITKAHQHEFLKSLLSLQYGIETRGGKAIDVTHDMNRYRAIDEKANGSKHLAFCHSEAFNVNCNITDSWIQVLPTYKADVVVSRSSRYHDKEEIDWTLLKEYDVLFLGFKRDYNTFVNKVGFSPKQMECKDALEMAQVIAGSKLFVGNQSLAFALAEAMKHPRVLEVCYDKNNCQPHGKDGYTCLTKELIGGYLND